MFGVDLVVLFGVALGVVLTGALVAWIISVLRASDPDRAVAKIYAFPSEPFALRFTTSSPGPHRVLLRFTLEHGGGRNDYGLTAQLELQVGSAPASSVEARIGSTARALGPHGVYVPGFVRAHQTHGTISATAKLAALPEVPPGTPVAITGTMVAADRSAATSLLVFVMPP